MVEPLHSGTAMKLAAVASVLLLASSVTASADDLPRDEDVRNENTALGLSIAGTLAGPALFAAGVYALDNSGAFDDEEKSIAVPGAMILSGAAIGVLGPSFGHWYAGKALTPGLAMRAGGLALAAAGGLGVIGDCEIDDGDCGASFGRIATYAGLATFVGGVVYDFATVRGRVRERNARAVQITPMVSGTTSGVSISGMF